MKKYTCIICGHKTLDSRCDWDICPVCFWEDDVLIRPGDGDDTSSANGGQRISDAQANFIIFGSCSKKHLADVRKPFPGEELDPQWRPLPEAVALVKSMHGQLDGG